MSNSTNNNDNAAKISELDLGEFMSTYKNTKICDLDITVEELFRFIGEYSDLVEKGNRRLRASAQGGIR